MNVREFGLRVRAVIERGWCQRYSAVDKLGVSTCQYSDDACRWCMSGAVSRVLHEIDKAGDDALDVSDELWDALATEAARSSGPEWGGYRSPVSFNDDDTRTQSDMIGLLDRALEKFPEAA